MKKSDNKPYTIRLPGDLLGLARKKAAAEGRTLSSVVADGLKAALGEKPKARRQRSSLPISSATGGLPGIDLSNSAAIQEMEDLEYLERMKHFK